MSADLLGQLSQGHADSNLATALVHRKSKHSVSANGG
jgi:hypothetical protein